MKGWLSILGTLFSVICVATTANSTSLMWVVGAYTDAVFTVDVNTLSASLIGYAGSYDVTDGGLGFSADGTLYAFRGGGLLTVNQSTGLFTGVGGSFLPGTDTFDIDPVSGAAIAFDVSGNLYDVDLSSGAASFRVATSPMEGGWASAFAPDGTYYQLDYINDELNIIDINTGVSTLVGNLGVDIFATNLSYNPDDNFLYSIGALDPNYPLYRINPLNGAGVLVGNISGFFAGSVDEITMATYNVNNPVPEPATMILLGTGLVGVAGAVRKKRKNQV